MRPTAQQVKELREMTGAGMLDCRSALEQADVDLAKAKEILAKKGFARAEKLSSRQTKQGRIGGYVHHNGRIGAMVELLCESDFVAANEEFRELLADLCLHVVGAAPLVVCPEELPKATVDEERAKYAEDVKGKPPAIAEKILAGKLEKNLYAKVCLLNQPFVNEEKFAGTVGERIQAVVGRMGENIAVRRFARFELGA